MSLLENIVNHNKNYLESKAYEKLESDKFPDKHLALVACMDARLVELLPQAMGLKNGDATLIKNAGALITHPWGSVMRSLLIAIYQLNAKEICIVAHHDCGVKGIDPEQVLTKAKANGISDETIKTLMSAGIDLMTWLKGFDKVEDSVRHTVDTVRSHPLIPKHVPVHGLVIHPGTGQLTILVNGYDALEAS
ncbi:MAG: carbonic anhydrase [Neisseriaceae bacterium]|nr:carbonic anhydrase [Neisseriaceae bacterium]